MPRVTKKSVVKETKPKRVSKTATSTPVTLPEETKSSINFSQIKGFSPAAIKNYRPSKRAYLVILLLGILLIGYYKKGWFVAAMVNGAPVSNFELLSRMNQQYRSQTLNQMVNEKIVLDEAKKQNIVISDSDVNKKITQVEANVGGSQALDSMLAQQGQTRASIRQQIRIQVAIEKLYASEATISADEVKNFIDQNKDQLQATTSAEQTKEATDILQQQKLSKAFNAKFQQLKQQAKVLIF